MYFPSVPKKQKQPPPPAGKTAGDEGLISSAIPLQLPYDTATQPQLPTDSAASTFPGNGGIPDRITELDGTNGCAACSQGINRSVSCRLTSTGGFLKG